MLHVDPENKGARCFYDSLGYEHITPDSVSPWKCLLGMHDAGGGLLLMVKPLRAFKQFPGEVPLR